MSKKGLNRTVMEGDVLNHLSVYLPDCGTNLTIGWLDGWGGLTQNEALSLPDGPAETLVCSRIRDRHTRTHTSHSHRSGTPFSQSSACLVCPLSSCPFPPADPGNLARAGGGGGGGQEDGALRPVVDQPN